MKIETQTLEEQQVQITAEVEPEELEKYKRRAAREIAKRSKIPGFRPGKAPYEVVKRLYGEETIQQQAVDLLVDELYPQILQQADVDPSGPGKLEEIVSLDPPTFSFIVPLQPEVELPDYRAVRKEYSLPEVSEDEVEEIIHNFQRNNGVAEPVERPAEKGDLVYTKVSGRYAKPAEGEEAEFIAETPLQFIAGEASPEISDWPYKGFSDELIGLVAEEEKSIPYTFPEDAPFERLRGKDVIFHVVVQSVKALKLPELDDEFARSLGEFETMEDVRKAVREQLENHHRQEYEENYIGDLIDEIVAGSALKYPPHVLEHEVEHVLEHLQEDLSRQQMDLETYFKTRDTDRETFIETEAKPVARKRLEQGLVLEELARKEHIQLEDNELQMAVLQRMNELQSVQQLEQIKTAREQRNLVNALAFDTANRLINQRLMERLKAIATGEQEKAEAEAEAAAQAEGTPENAEAGADAANAPTAAVESSDHEEAGHEEAPTPSVDEQSEADAG